MVSILRVRGGIDLHATSLFWPGVWWCCLPPWARTPLCGDQDAHLTPVRLGENVSFIMYCCSDRHWWSAPCYRSVVAEGGGTLRVCVAVTAWLTGEGSRVSFSDSLLWLHKVVLLQPAAWKQFCTVEIPHCISAVRPLLLQKFLPCFPACSSRGRRHS